MSGDMKSLNTYQHWRGRIAVMGVRSAVIQPGLAIGRFASGEPGKREYVWAFNGAAEITSGPDIIRVSIIEDRREIDEARPFRR
jgi:hypothetical protein